ncbi:MAG: SDR family oxidoreductase [Saprospiraceae bacterium]|nr:SDR family oxidoreductase [Saprospiraceae bacterium]
MSTKFSLEGKVAVVTGGGSGIGRAICEVFCQAGATVFILDINEEAARATCRKCHIDERRAIYCDLSSQKEVNQAISTIEGHHNIDILVNNAGIGFVGNLEQTDEETFDKLMSVNVKGVYNCLYACIGYMKAREHGVILNMASTVSTVAIPDRFAYTTTKGAVLTMTYSVALDYLHHGIRCNAIAPARVHTPFVDAYLEKNYPERKEEMFKILSNSQPIGRMARPEEIANLALYLCSDEAAFTTGQCYSIDGGFLNLRP